MPPICLHLGIAQEAITRLGHPVVDENRGSFYLGATAPDIRLLVDAGREATHFLPLDSEGETSGVGLMFAAYPELVEKAHLNASTRSFVAGYLSHLVTDETWIRGVYRPFFGKASPLGGDAMANILDRLLQFELDRRERLNTETMAGICADIDNSAASVNVRFIDGSNLSRWRDFVCVAASRKASITDFRRFAENYPIWMRQITPEDPETFFASFDARLEQVLTMIPQDRLQAFRGQSVDESVKVAREYLG